MKTIVEFPHNGQDYRGTYSLSNGSIEDVDVIARLSGDEWEDVFEPTLTLLDAAHEAAAIQVQGEQNYLKYHGR